MGVGRGWRALAWGLVVVLWMEGCAMGAGPGTGGSGLRESRGLLLGSAEWDGLEEARSAELEAALDGMWGVAREVREEGAVLEFTFWAEGGAFTLLSVKRREWGSALGSAQDRESFVSELREILPAYAEGGAGAVHLTLRREESGWRADFRQDKGIESPPEAKTWPVKREGLRAEQLQGLMGVGRQVAARVWVPEGARVRWQVEVELEDERVMGFETSPPGALPGGKAVRQAPELVGEWVSALAPFTQGLGARKVRMEWEGEHVAGTGPSHWKLVGAEVVRPPPPVPQNAEVVLEYRAMHEQIQRQWRQETRESFQTMGLFSAEQVALWVVGGLAARGLGAVVEAAAPTVGRVLARGGTEAVGWFRSLLIRAVPAEKQALGQLMAKAETQGLKALTGAERTELQSLLERLEGIASAPLEEKAKGRLRLDAQVRFYEEIHPELAALLKEANGHAYDVHHCIPLEFAHKFPLRDVNSAADLVAAGKPVHESIGRIWTRLRSMSRDPDAKTVVEVERLVRKHFGRWFNQVYSQARRADEALSSAERAALEELELLLRNR
jgi:hypothetical protein